MSPPARRWPPSSTTPAAGWSARRSATPELLRHGQALRANLDSITTKVNEGKGLIAKLINDEELGEKLSRLFTQVTGALEDVREAAPVGTFFQVLAGPF